MKGRKGRIGRPSKAPKGGGRVHIGLRVTADMKRYLMREAERSGRSMSQEVELRLELSRDRQANFERFAYVLRDLIKVE